MCEHVCVVCLLFKFGSHIQCREGVYQRRLEVLLKNITLIAYLCLEFHVSLNSRNTKLANSGDHWRSLDI